MLEAALRRRAVALSCWAVALRCAASCGGRDIEHQKSAGTPDASRDASEAQAAGCDLDANGRCETPDASAVTPTTRDGSVKKPIDSGAAQSRPADAARAESGTSSRLDGARDSAPEPTDALLGPDCDCPPGDYFVDADVGGASVHLTEPYRFFLACDETTPELLHNPCGTIYRLTACALPGSAPPCLYVAVNRATGPLIGDYVDPTGQTWDLRSGSIEPEATHGFVATGTFSATYVNPTSDASLAVTGSYSACAPSFPACED